MKKYLVLFGAAILVMAFASPSMAQFKSWGHMDIQTIWEVKPDFNTGQPWTFDANQRDAGRNVTWRHVAERFRFYLQYGDAKTVRAVIGFEADSADWGEAYGSGTTGNNTTFPPIGTNAYGAGAQHMGVYRTDQVQLEIKHAYMDFTVPNTPISISAGLQFFDVAGRMWMNNDAPGVIVTANFAPHRIRALWWREMDNNRFSYSVNDTYVLAWDMTKQLFNAGLWAAYKNDLFTGQIGSYSFPGVYSSGVTAGTWATSTQTTPGAVETQTYTITLTTPANKYNDHPWYAGVSGGFRPGNLDISGQLIYNGGKRQFTNITTVGAPTGDSTYQAWAGEVALKYRVGPGLFAGIEGYYASGQDYNKSDKITQYTVPNTSEGQSIFGNDRTVFMWMNAAQMGYFHERNFTITGFWYARANVEFSPLTWLRMNLNYLYIGDTNSGSPFSSTSPGFSPLTRLPLTAASKLVNTPTGARTDVDKSFVGQELNLITTFRIYQNFDYNVGVFVFFPSDMFDRVNANGTTNGASTAYGVNTKLIYAF